MWHEKALIISFIIDLQAFSSWISIPNSGEPGVEISYKPKIMNKL
jgi:hypothetical protein